MNAFAGAFSQLTDITGLSSVSKWFSGFDDTNLSEFAALLREWPECPPSIKAELDLDHPPAKGRIHHHLVAGRNDPEKAFEHLKLITEIRDDFRRHICSGGSRNGDKFRSFRSALLADKSGSTPTKDVIRELSAGKIALVGASETGGITYLLHGKRHLPSESEGGFPRESSIRVGALVLARLALLADATNRGSSSPKSHPPPTQVNVIVDLTDTGLSNLDRGLGLTMGELISATNLREGDDPIPSAPCVKFRKMIIINANWVYTAIWGMVRPFVGEEWLDVISFEAPSSVPDLTHIPPSRLPSSLGGSIPLENLLRVQPEPSTVTPEQLEAQDVAIPEPDCRHDIDSVNAAQASGSFVSPSAHAQAGVVLPTRSLSLREQLQRAATGTARWHAATAAFFLDPSTAWEEEVPALDEKELFVVHN